MKQYNLNLNSWNSFLSFDYAKIRQEYHRNKKTADFFIDLLRQEPCFATKCRQYMKSCRKNVEDIVEVSDRDNDRVDRDKTLENNDLKNSDQKGNDRDDRANQAGVPYKDLDGTQKNIIQFCSIPRSAREILEHIGYSYHPTNIAKFIKPLLELGFIEMTEPDKPNSKNQKYRKVISGNS